MRITGLFLMFSLVGGLQAADPNESKQPDYLHDTFGLMAVGKVVVRATYGEILDNPKEWGRGIDGYGIRLGSAFGSHFVKNSIQFPVAAWRHEDMRYHPSTEAKFGGRLKHALISTVVTRNLITGESTFAAGRVSGIFGSALISRTWQPAPDRTVAGGFSSAGISLAIDAGVNVLREFWKRPKHNKSVPVDPKNP